MHNQLVIIGAGGHGKVVADIAKSLEQYQTIFFLDDDLTIGESLGIPVVGSSGMIEEYLSSSDVFVAVGKAAVRKKIMEQLLEKGANIPVLVHPQAVVGTGVEIGAGTVVMAGTVINADVKIGKGCIINTCASVDHDSIVGDYVHVAVGAHLAGNVCVGKHAWIGAGATVSNNVSIGEDVTVGAGAVVVKDLIRADVYVGIPAKRIKHNDFSGGGINLLHRNKLLTAGLFLFPLCAKDAV